MVVRPSALSKTHFMPYFVSLLTANLLQAVGGILNVKWAVLQAVEESPVCTVQGFIKQAGNVGTAIWYVLEIYASGAIHTDISTRSLVIAVCVFRLMFLRTPSSPLLNYCVLVLGWVIVVFIVAIGPLAIQSPDKGAYFGPSGYW